MRNLAIIPVRTGSKRLKNKNVLDFFGRPMFIHTVEAAINSGLFDEIHVSTESDEVVALSAELDVSPLFMRPDNLVTDEATLQQVCEFVIDAYEKRGKYFDSFCILWATSPLRSILDIKDSYILLNNHDAVVSVCDYDLPYFSGHILSNKNVLTPLFPDMLHGSKNRPEAVCINSSLCWVNVKAFHIQKTWLPSELKAYKMPRWRSTDIDTQEDLEWAEFLYNRHILQ